MEQQDLTVKEVRIEQFSSHSFWLSFLPASVLGFLQAIRTIFCTDFGGLGNLSARYMNRFNAETPNDPNVRYFSWSGYTRIASTLFMYVEPSVLFARNLGTYSIESSVTFPISRLYGPTDGLVNVDSARWGTHLENFAGQDQ